MYGHGFNVLKYLKLLRVHHWVKNSFIFIAPFFGGVLFDPVLLLRLFAGVIAFGLAASAVYVFNDLQDLAEDRLHPVKKNRPIASGAVPPGHAVVLMIAVLVAGCLLALWVDHKLIMIVIAYVLLNAAYSLGLKRISILDIFIVSSGFIFRTVAGGMLSEIMLSHWLMIMILLLALFLAIAKRRDDLIIARESGKVLRKASAQYSLEFVNTILAMFAAVIIVSYIMYTISPEVTSRLSSEYLYLTVIFVIMGLMRYLQLCLVQNASGSPVKILLNDRFIQFTILGWIGLFLIIIYYHP
jgi:4-hydroxybenzoate polyprenyltransferase